MNHEEMPLKERTLPEFPETNILKSWCLLKNLKKLNLHLYGNGMRKEKQNGKPKHNI